MTAYVAFLRAVNVSGTGKLPMAELRRMGEECGFANVRTYIASGNLLFESKLSEAKVAGLVADKVAKWFGKPVPVLVRSAAEMRAIADSNPFPEESGSRNFVFFLAGPPPADFMAAVRGREDERIAAGRREICVAYGEGIGKTKLVIPAVKTGTARNRNTVEKIAAMLEEQA
ncbi:DUF1697 domain-containing protein [Sphingomonas rosea]|uniref:DUF1697 domain-containing protein n=1 Tax=Sphingomonas rosea TaxID=335605 RepID=A0ABP7U0C6_9SPHN